MEILLIIAAVAGMVWGAAFLLRGSLLWGLLLMLLLCTCFGWYFYTVDAGPITLTSDRLWIVLLTGAFVVQRKLGKIPARRITTDEIVLLGFLGVLTLSTVLGMSSGLAQSDVPTYWRLIAGYYMPATMYWIGRRIPLSARDVNLVLAAMGLFGLYLGVTAIAEVTQQWWAVFPKYIANPKVGLHFGRARGPMCQQPTGGMYIVACFLAALLWLPQLKRRPLQLLLAALLPIYLAGIYFSLTRSVWIGLVVGLLIVLFLVLRGAWKPLVLGSMIFVGLFAAVTMSDKFVGLKREESAEQAAQSAGLRVSFAYVSWQMFLDKPFLGCGFGNFTQAKLPYLDDHSVELKLQEIRTLSHHNTFLSVLTETGLIGLVCFLSLLFVFTRSGWKAWRDPATPDWAKPLCVLFLGTMGAYASQLAFHDLTYTPMESTLIYTLAGLVASIRTRSHVPGELGQQMWDRALERPEPITDDSWDLPTGASTR
ncbi:MAG: O-antigen ligase family protein [Pirellulales bacterium]|nr:O-antigen ligase family protein [Pirellulales bacterium]